MTKKYEPGDIPAIRINHTMTQQDAKLVMAYTCQHPTPALAELGATVAREYRHCFCHFCSGVATMIIGVGDSRGICSSCADETPKCSRCGHFATMTLEDGVCRLCWCTRRSS